MNYEKMTKEELIKECKRLDKRCTELVDECDKYTLEHIEKEQELKAKAFDIICKLNEE